MWRVRAIANKSLSNSEANIWLHTRASPRVWKSQSFLKGQYWMRHGMPCRWFGGKTKRVGCDCQGGLCCNVVASFSHPHLRPWPVPSIDLWPCLTRLGSTRRALPLLHSLPTGIESFSLQARNLTNVDQSLRFIEGVVETRVQI